MVVGRDGKYTRQRKQHVLRPRGRNREGSVKLEYIEKGAVNKGPYYAGLRGQVVILSFITRAVGANG